jgi:hypothetical protein
MKMKQTINERFTKLKQRKFKSELKRKQKLEQFAAEHNIEYTYDAPYSKIEDNPKLCNNFNIEILRKIQDRLNYYIIFASKDKNHTNYASLQALAVYTTLRDLDLYITNKLAAQYCDISSRSLENAKKKFAKKYVNTYPEFRKPRSNK